MCVDFLKIQSRAIWHVTPHTDLVELSVGAEYERQDMKHLDPYHSSRLVPFSKMTAKRDDCCKSKKS